MTRLAGSEVISVDFQVPDIATGYGNGTNSITATSFTDLPTNACSAAITNPHSTADLIVLVEFGAWMYTTGSAVRACPRVSGSVTIAAGIGAGGPLGWGEVIATGNSPNPQQLQGGSYYTLPNGTATFTMQAFRDSASGSQFCNYPTLRLVPLYFSL